MGDRYTITADKSKMASRFDVEILDAYQPHYNAAPTHILPVITQGSKGLSFFYWGEIPDWSKNKSIASKLIYAEGETVAEKASTKQQFLNARCIIPADGFYEWKRVSKKGKIPHRFIFGDNEIRSFAGLWEEFEDNEGNNIHTFKIITTTANGLLSEMNARMPVIFEKEQEKIWLDPNSDPEELQQLLQPYSSDKMGSYTVSPQFKDPNNEGPSLIEPYAPADQFGNYSLFD